MNTKNNNEMDATLLWDHENENSIKLTLLRKKKER